jgi:hypothetical protein
MFNLPPGIHWHNTDELGSIHFTADNKKIANDFAKSFDVEIVGDTLTSKDNPRGELRIVGGIEYSEVWKCYTIRVHGSIIFKEK